MTAADDYTVQVRSSRTGGTEAVRVDGAGRALLVRGTWWVSADGYCVGRLGGRLTSLHRQLCYPPPGPGQHVDHRNGDRLDCRRANLEPVSVSENMRRRVTARGVSGVKGVSQTTRGTWRARVYLDGAEVRLGEYKTRDRAAKAVADWEARYRDGLPSTIETD